MYFSKLPRLFLTWSNYTFQRKYSRIIPGTDYLKQFNYISRSSYIWNKLNDYSNISKRLLSSETDELTDLKYSKVSDMTLDSIAEAFELLDFKSNEFPEYDVEHANGVLTVKFGQDHGTYVVNKQSPNKQIWLSSPYSGPKRYDFINDRWIYKHDGTCLHDLLSKEISDILKRPISFENCEYT